MSRPPALTSTSYAILGLLAVQPWTTHELVRQVDRSLRRFWPRAQSKLYEEPKKLVAQGLARASDDPVGRRRRTRYTITPAGRRALATWVGEPAEGPALEFEQLLKIAFADSGTTADVRTHLAATLEWARRQNDENLAVARSYLAGEGAFPQRAAVNHLTGRFLTDFYLTVARWAAWATEVVETWPDDPRDAVVDRATQQETVRRAEEATAVAAGSAGPAATAGPAVTDGQ